MNTAWFEDETKALLRLKKAGKSWQAIAEELTRKYGHRDYTANCCKKRFHKIPPVEEPETHEEGECVVTKNGTAKTTSESTSKAWSDDEMLLLYAFKSVGNSFCTCADSLEHCLGTRDYNENSCQKKYQNTNWDQWFQDRKDRFDQLSMTEDDDGRKQKIIDDTLARQEKMVRNEKTRTQIIIESLKSAIYRLPKPKALDINYTKPSKHYYSEEHMGVMLSDLHVGAKYTLAETGGLGEYGLDIFKRRVDMMKRSVLEIAERHRLMYDIPHLHVFSLGDIVAGMRDSGAWSPVYIDLEPYEQIVYGFSALRDLLACWSRAFPKVTVYGMYGNHGRIGRAGINKVSSNWDRIIHKLTQESLSEYDNIEWIVPEAWWYSAHIQNHHFYLTHGDGIKGSLGIPYYGVERQQSRVGGLLDSKPDYTLIGHFHATAELSTNYGKVYMNGSFMGGDMYSLKDLARGDKPEQKVFGIHHKKGVTWMYNLHLDSED